MLKWWWVELQINSCTNYFFVIIYNQASSLFDHLKSESQLKCLEVDNNVNISTISDTVFTDVINSLSSVKFVGTVISNKQLTALLTRVLNEGN